MAAELREQVNNPAGREDGKGSGQGEDALDREERERLPAVSRLTLIGTALLVAAALCAALVYIFVAHDPLAWLDRYLSRGMNPVLFAALMAILPLAGAPISVFLVLVGMIFGVSGGILVTGLLMLFHLAATWFIVHSLFRPLVIRLLDRTEVPVPRLPRRGGKRLAFVFMLVPGVPYTAKNYLLALSGLSLRPYLVISWLAQFALSIPFILLGKAVIKMDLLVLGAVLLLILLGFAGQNYLRRRYGELRRRIPPTDL